MTFEFINLNENGFFEIPEQDYYEERNCNHSVNYVFISGPKIRFVFEC